MPAGYNSHSTITASQWTATLSRILNRPDPVTVHTVLLPEGYHGDFTEFSSAKVVEERVYNLKPGQLPDLAKRPAQFFDAHVEPTLLPAGANIAPYLSVIDPTQQQQQQQRSAAIL